MPFSRCQTGIQVSYGIEDTQTSTYCSFGHHPHCLGYQSTPRVHPKEFGRYAIKACDDLSTDALISRTTSDTLRGRVRREFGGIDRSQNITVSCRLSASGEGTVGRGVTCRRAVLAAAWCWLTGLRATACASPIQTRILSCSSTAVVCLNQVDFQVFNIIVIEVKSALQDTIGDALFR